MDRIMSAIEIRNVIEEEFMKNLPPDRDGVDRIQTEAAANALFKIGIVKRPSADEINQVIRNHFSTVFQKPDIMIAIVEAGNGASQDISEMIGGSEVYSEAGIKMQGAYQLKKTLQDIASGNIHFWPYAARYNLARGLWPQKKERLTWSG